MSDVTVSIGLTKKQQGELYMQNMRRGERIKELCAGLRTIIAMAEEDRNFGIVTKAKALLEVPKTKG